jgi:hypothetical protein
MDDSTRSGRVTFQALFERTCECANDPDCWCALAEGWEKYWFEEKTIEPPRQVVHVEECENASCPGCWIYELDGALPLF